MGCTEPIAVAYAAALARDTLGNIPEETEVAVSDSILKNVKSVIVPNTGGMRGVATAVAAGFAAGKAERKLEVISEVSETERHAIAQFLKTQTIRVMKSDTGCVFDIGMHVKKGEDTAYVRISGHHTNVVHIEKNGQVLFDKQTAQEEQGANAALKAEISVRQIVEFADTVDLADVEELLSRQIEYNTAIAQEGLKNDYGARVGKILLQAFGGDVHNLAKATAAAGSDQRVLHLFHLPGLPRHPPHL